MPERDGSINFFLLYLPLPSTTDVRCLPHSWRPTARGKAEAAGGEEQALEQGRPHIRASPFAPAPLPAHSDESLQLPDLPISP